MKKYLCMCISCAFVFFAKAQEERLRDYVNPFVGTDGYGNIYPGSQIPFGGIQIITKICNLVKLLFLCFQQLVKPC